MFLKEVERIRQSIWKTDLRKGSVSGKREDMEHGKKTESGIYCPG